MKLILYGTLGCHLCYEAFEVTKPLLDLPCVEFEKVDIADSDTLLEMYATRIPVLYRPDIQMELDWPFDQSIVDAFLRVDE